MAFGSRLRAGYRLEARSATSIVVAAAARVFQETT
jgi:hypothetical protein